MGLDVLLSCDKRKEMREDPNNTLGITSLSRTFCRLLSGIWNGKMEDQKLSKIGQICGLDLSIFYVMMESADEDYEFRLPYAKTEEERQLILKEIELKEKKLANNLAKVQNTILALMEKLQGIPNLAELLHESQDDQSELSDYFTDFDKNPGDGYIGNNFGQDLRNFKRYLEIAASHGASRVWFSFG